MPPEEEVFAVVEFVFEGTRYRATMTLPFAEPTWTVTPDDEIARIFQEFIQKSTREDAALLFAGKPYDLHDMRYIPDVLEELQSATLPPPLGIILADVAAYLTGGRVVEARDGQFWAPVEKGTVV